MHIHPDYITLIRRVLAGENIVRQMDSARELEEVRFALYRAAAEMRRRGDIAPDARIIIRKNRARCIIDIRADSGAPPAGLARLLAPAPEAIPCLDPEAEFARAFADLDRMIKPTGGQD